MRLIYAGALLTLSALPSTARAQAQPVQTDGIAANLIETLQVFHCAQARATLRYREALRLGQESLPLAQRRRIQFSSLSLTGRRLSATGSREIAALFNRFAWIERVAVRCGSTRGAISFTVEGMDAEAWAAFGEGRATQRPPRSIVGFTISAHGRVRIS